MLGFRLGSAFILIGLIVLTVYLLNFAVEHDDPLLLLVGLMISLIGLLLRRRAASRAKQRSTRFHTVRRLLGWRVDEQMEE